MNLDKLLKPNRICVVGASEKIGFGGDTCRNIMDHMSEDRYYFVNPKKEKVFGKEVYGSMSELPEEVDLVILCTPAATIISLLEEAKVIGASAAVIYASGYQEVGTDEGIEAQKAIIEKAIELDIAIMGPNCAGYINYIDNVHAFAFLSEERDRKGSVGFISQSGQLCLSMMENPATKFSYCISAGNAAVTTIEDYMDFLIEDDDTKVLAIYLEGIKHPKKFIEVLRKAATKKKPVVVLKAGSSIKGSQVAASHTGSLSGSDKSFDALCSKFGVMRVNDLEELIYTAQIFATLKKVPEGTGIASMNLSGGETGICADVGEMHGIHYPDFTNKTIEKLRELLPGYASLSNPLDMTATLSYDTDKFAEALRTVMSDENISIVIVGYTLLEKITDNAIYYMAQAMERVSGESNSKPMAMLPFSGNTRNQAYAEKLEGAGVPILPTPVYAFKIIRNLCDFVSFDYSKIDDTLSIPSENKQLEKVFLTEHKAKLLLKEHGVNVPPEGIARSKEEAVNLVKEIGFPVVMKISSIDILHKSDCGGVILSINSEEEVKEAYDLIISNSLKHYPDAIIDGILVQHMAEKGRELIIGVSRDPQLGPVILVGLGGVFVEVFKDTSLALAPVSKFEAKKMVENLKSYKMLGDYRGEKATDIDAIENLIVSVSRFATKYKDSLLELDLNPVFANDKGVCAVDAVIVSNKELII